MLWSTKQQFVTIPHCKQFWIYLFPSKNLFPNVIYIFPKSFCCRPLDKYNSKRNYENPIRTWAPNYAIVKKYKTSPYGVVLIHENILLFYQINS